MDLEELPPASNYYSRQNWSTLYTRAHSIFIHNTQVSSTCERHVLCPYNAILFGLRKEGNSATCYDVDKP